MSRPSILVNTYVTSNCRNFIDIISKVFIIAGLCLGINRLRVFSNLSAIFKIFSFVYSFICACLYTLLWWLVIDNLLSTLAFSLHYLQVMLIIVINLVTHKNLQCLYNELNVFDAEVGCRPKNGKESIYNFICTAFMLSYIIGALGMPLTVKAPLDLHIMLSPFVLCHILEVHYCAHLLSLLLPRLRLINYYMELSLSKSKIVKKTNMNDFGYSQAKCNRSLCAMGKIMNLYHLMINAYNYFVEAIKWQILISLSAAFVAILVGSYKVALRLMQTDGSLVHLVGYVLLTAGLLVPWFSPCTLGDQVHYEVIRLRELLAFRIYEKKMDKSGRAKARALLAWTETRNLSFSLLCMFDVDISLPFKFIGFLVTYLIILLQFQRVMTPN